MINQTKLLNVPKLNTLGFILGAMADITLPRAVVMCLAPCKCAACVDIQLWHGFRTMQLLAEISVSTGFAQAPPGWGNGYRSLLEKPGLAGERYADR
jgi:hypothetical protein